MFIAIDLETTGFDPEKDNIIEFGAVKFDLSGVKETYQTLLNPEIPIPHIITHITGITNETLKDAPTLKEKLNEIREFIGEDPIVGHNIAFDTGFLKNKGFELNNPEYDTLEFASISLPGLPSYSLEILSTALNLTHKEKHRALDDAIATMELFLKLTEKFQNLDADLIKKIQTLLPRSNWPLKDFLLTLPHKKSPSKKQVRKKSPKKFTKKKNKILQIKESALFEFPAPYEKLVRQLALSADENVYLAVPGRLFGKIALELPDNIAKIDSPKNYISLQRLEQFSRKEFFENNEIAAIIKYLIWLKETKTGLISEVSFINQERETLPFVNADDSYTDISKEPFINKAVEKDKDACALISHEYLIEKKPEIENLILVDFEQFSRKVAQLSSKYLTLNHLLMTLENLDHQAKNNETTSALVSKTTILFGMIGILFDKNHTPDQSTQRTMITSQLFGTQQWQETKRTVQNMIDLSKDFGKINNEKTAPLLKTWKSQLTTIFEILCEPDLENFLIWIERNYYEEIVLRKSPLSIRPLIREILNNSKIYKIIDENVDLMDDGAFFKRNADLPADLPVHKPKFSDKKLHIFISQNSPEYEYNENQNIIPNFLLEAAKAKKGRMAIICNAKNQLTTFTLFLSQKLAKEGIKVISQMTGSVSKTSEKFKEHPESSILLMTPNAWENFTAHEEIKDLFIYKLPFEPPDTDYIFLNSRDLRNPLMELQVPKAIGALKKIINRIQKGNIILLDSRVLTKNYGRVFLNNLNYFGKTETLPLDKLINEL